MGTLLIIEAMLLSAAVFCYGFKVLIDVLANGRAVLMDAVIIAFGWLALMNIGLFSFIYGCSQLFG